MTENIVVVEPSVLNVTVDTGTPVTTIVDNTTGSTTVVDTAPVTATIVDERPKVTVQAGGGGSLDLTSVMTLLTGQLTSDQMDTTLYSDLAKLSDLWKRTTNELILTYPEGVVIEEAGRSYTDTSISDAVSAVTVTTDGKVASNTSLIEQTEASIAQTVTALEQTVDDKLAVQETSIVQNASSISQTVTDLVTTDNNVALAQAAILQNAFGISLGVTKQTENEESIITVGSRVTLTEDTIDLAVESFDDTTSRVAAAEISITEQSVLLSTSTSYLTQTVETVQEILNNQWGVTIEEDINGNSYVAGFGLLLHPTWVIGDGYAIDATVYYLDNAYICIQDNLADATNLPTNAAYWTLVPGGAKSIFTVNAEEFQVTGPNGLEPLFLVDSETGIVTINGALVVTSLQSTNYGVAGKETESWFSFDPDTGEVKINNMTLTFTSTEAADALATQLLSPLFLFDDSQAIPTSTTEAGAFEWTFDSTESGGVAIQIEVPDDFDGILGVSLNDVVLTMDLWDSGSVADEAGLIIDLNEVGNAIDLGGLF